MKTKKTSFRVLFKLQSILKEKYKHPFKFSLENKQNFVLQTIKENESFSIRDIICIFQRKRLK
jgi:hypothetical protein